MMDNSKPEMDSLGAGCHGSPVGVRLGAVMEHLQRQQEAKLHLEREEKHLRQAQLAFAKHVAAARVSGAPLDSSFRGKSIDRTQTEQQQTADRYQSRAGVGYENEDDEQGSGGEDDEEDDDMDDEEHSEGEDALALNLKKPPLQQNSIFSFTPFSTSLPTDQPATSPPMTFKQEPEEKELSPLDQHSFTSPNGLTDWSFDEQFKQKGSVSWAEENEEQSRARAEPSRDFAKLYELDGDPNRKEFLDELFIFMQKRGTPVNRIPIMAKQVLDLYKLYKLVTEKGGLVEVINKKIWREITKGLNLPTSITSAAFTLRTQYMKYLYPFECDKKGLSSPGELQAAIDGNRREGRRASFNSSLFHYSPSQASAPHSLLSSPKIHTHSSGHNGLHSSPIQALKRRTDDASGMLPSRLPMALGLGQQQMAQAATLEHLRERLERAAGGEGPDRKIARLAEEQQQRLIQQAFQQNLLAMASHFNPVKQPAATNNDHESKQDLSLSISTNGAASISVSVEVNGTLYSGMLYAQKSSAASLVSMTTAGQSGFGSMSSTHSPTSSSSPSSSKGPN
ncbi:AT-rich interactive domain-containing protein 3A-like [Hypomesus transpacificus]|uniref:AT-rich interactive domain-containing protein 3A-like n=1 Tax=Hypomesus transpacificus TaxID=137520 RepID=UPI001F075963|nr:AT-rich interactive domain-containing protein 3A-like [Hypomesus transpacificus]